MSDRDQDPPRSPARKTKKTGGFKWKQKPSTADDGDDRRDSRDSRDGRRSRYDDDYRGSSYRGGRDDYRNDTSRDYRDRDRDRDRDYRRNRSRSRSPRRDRDRDDERDRRPREGRDRDVRPPKREKKEKSAAPAAAPLATGGEEMIIVHVNDRLGTKAAIPCLASDPVGAFKVIVAMKIGREPHQIMLKRQGERPFKDHITLGDYGVSNGVQLDLEVDTGD